MVLLNPSTRVWNHSMTLLNVSTRVWNHDFIECFGEGLKWFYNYIECFGEGLKSFYDSTECFNKGIKLFYGSIESLSDNSKYFYWLWMFQQGSEIILWSTDCFGNYMHHFMTLLNVSKALKSLYNSTRCCFGEGSKSCL